MFYYSNAVCLSISLFVYIFIWNLRMTQVIEEFLKLKTKYQEVIADITQKMGFGMSKFLGAQVETKEDYNEVS